MANFEQAIDPPRGFNARERRVAALSRYGKILTEVSDVPGRPQDGGDHCSRGEAAAAASPGLTLVKFPIE
ncbi:MAG TPA: hypothetical protein VIH87_12440 [Methylocella sp.]